MFIFNSWFLSDLNAGVMIISYYMYFSTTENT